MRVLVYLVVLPVAIEWEQDISEEIKTERLIKKTATIVVNSNGKAEVARTHTSYFELTFQTPYVIARIPIATTAVLVAQFDGRTHQPPRAEGFNWRTANGRR